jgi:dinuclear metal center YbgI/SA1388 family protein
MNKVSDIYKKLDKLFPFNISDLYVKTFNSYDNSGIIIDLENEIHKILWSLDFSEKTIDKAISEKADLIITHHPAIYIPIKNINKKDNLGKKLIKAITNNISVISMHLNCDMAQGGVDEKLSQIYNPQNITILQELGNNTGYGRIFDIEENTLENLLNITVSNLQTDKITVYGQKNKSVKRVATFCGGGFEVDFFDKFKADLIITSDLKHHLITEAIERNFAVLNISHYGAENYSFKKISNEAKEYLKIDSIYFEDKILL